MLNKILYIIVIYFSFVFHSFGQNDNIQKYLYDDKNISISVSSVYSMSNLDTLYVSIEIQNKGQEKYFFTQTRFALNKTSCIVILDLGGLFEPDLDTEVEMLCLKPWEKTNYQFKITKSSLQDTRCFNLFRLSLSIGFVEGENAFKGKVLSRDKMNSNIIKISSVQLDEILNILDLGLYDIKM
jgi:hypothetical protein